MTTFEERKARLNLYRRELGDNLYQYLLDSGFLTCPASVKYHGNYEGGLFDHSFAMKDALLNLTLSLGLRWQKPESPIIVSFCHDLCKLDNYREEMGTPIEGTDKYTPSYTYNDDKLLDGHGVKSVIVALQHITLTEEEIMCIRYHMGAYEKADWDFYDRAIKKYPNVLYTHMADMIASKIMGV